MKFRFVFLALLFTFSITNIFSQDFDCLTKLKIRQAKAPYKINDLSKSAICKTGEKYEYNIDLQKNKDYRLTFFASSVFNNRINFKIYNKKTGEMIMNLPGISIDNIQGCALEAYFDKDKNRMVHPFFDFSPNIDTQLEIIIEVESDKSSYEFDAKSLIASNEKKGCITVFVQSKDSEPEGFQTN